MERTFAPGARRFGSAARDLRFGKTRLWRGGRVLLCVGAGHLPGDLPLHAFSDPRRPGCSLVDARFLFFSAQDGRAAAIAVGLLGISWDCRAECPDEGTDRARLPRSHHIRLPAAHQESAPLAADVLAL